MAASDNGYRYPKAVAEMLPVRQAELAAILEREPIPVCPANASHGPMTPRPLDRQTYEQMFCGVWFDCSPQPFGCTSSRCYSSRDICAQLGEPHRTDDGWERWGGSAWVAVSDEDAAAFWAARQAEVDEADRRRQAGVPRRSRKAVAR